MITDSISEPVKAVIDWGSFGTAVGAFFKLVPELSALVGLVWLCIRVWETDTVQKLRKKEK